MAVASSIKISKEKATFIIHAAILIIAGLSTILRPSIESNITLFRVVLPFLFLGFFVVNTKKAITLSVVIIVFLIYSLMVSLAGKYHAFSVVFNLYYITVFFFYFYCEEVVRSCKPESIHRLLVYIYKTIIVLAYIQLFFGGVYFNTQDRLPAVNIFFWNENELSAVIAIFTPLFFLKSKSNFKYFWLAAAIYMILYNDAKLALLSLIVFFGGYLIIKFKVFKIRYIGFIFLGALSLILLFFLREYSIQGKYTIEYFLSRLANGVWTQQPLEHIGTFNSRSNAIILGVRDLLDSYFLGIGPGNSLLMIKEIVVPGTERYSALSMHNFTLQIITEMGIFGIGIIGFFILKVNQAAKRSYYPVNLVFLFFISSLISITLLSGAWSNYFYLFILFYAVDFFGKNV